MATHSSILAWSIPWTEEPGELQSMGLHGVGHDCSNLTQAHSPINALSWNFQRNISQEEGKLSQKQTFQVGFTFFFMLFCVGFLKNKSVYFYNT